MSKTNAPQEAIELLKKVGINPQDAMWNCHGTWVMYHKACERIGAHLNIQWDMPQIIEHEAGKSVAIVVRGSIGDKSEWSFGEAHPKNCKNGYYYAMAEKRAKDRVILKLAGLHGEVYSQEESDDFTPNKQANAEMTGGEVYHPAKQDMDNLTALVEALDNEDAQSSVEIWNLWGESGKKWAWANLPTRGNGMLPKTKLQQRLREYQA